MTSSSAGNLPDFMPLWDYDHPDSTEAKFRLLLPPARAAGDSDYVAQLLTQIARTEGLQREFDDAQRTLDEAEAMIRPEMKKARVRLLLERGRVFNSSKDKDKARPLFLSAWDLAREAGEENLAVDAAHMMGIVAEGDESVEWNRKAMREAEQAKDPKAKNWLGALYNNLGWTYHDKGDYAAALDLFKKGYDWRRERNQPKETRIAKWCVARALRSLGRTDEALAMQRELLQEWQAAGDQDGYVYEELGEGLLSLGNADEAKGYFAQAYGLLSKDPGLAADEPKRLQRLAELGGVTAR